MKNKEVTALARAAIKRLLQYLAGLDFRCSNEEFPNLKAERKLTTTITSNFTLVIWTTVTGASILPKGTKLMQFLLIASRPNGRSEIIWKLSKVDPYVNKATFQKRFRRQAQLLIAIANCARVCKQHTRSMRLTTAGSELFWTCTEGGCKTQYVVGQAFANLIRRHTPASYWRSKHH